MFSNEPGQSPYDVHFKVLDFPVRIHWGFWLSTAIFGHGASGGRPLYLLLWMAAVFSSILLHELGHALVMRRFGEDPWIVLLFMGGLACSRGGRRSSAEQIAISLAGPGVQLFLAALIVLVIRGSGFQLPCSIPFWPEHWPDIVGDHLRPIPFEGMSVFFAFMIWINVFWALFNLLPVFPLDGGQVARAGLQMSYPQDGLKLSLWLSVICAGAVALWAFQQQYSYMGMMFAILAWDSYQAIQTYFGGSRRW